MSELITDGSSGRLVPPGDPDALARALQQVVDSSELAESYASSARETLAERFSTGRMLDRLRAIYVGTARAS
jgi:glycosyltransferase involved in cell wall biosynthesis